jgi:flagellar protein FliS
MFTSPHPRTARPGFMAYQEVGATTAIEGASPHKLVSLLFTALVSEIARARGALARGDVAEKCRAASKAVRILDEGLRAPLDLQGGGELAQNLSDLYGYMIQRLTLANLHNDDAMMAECARLAQTLREGWDGIAEQVHAPAAATV